MNDETISVWHDPEVEVRIVAMVLGEASAFEKAELERMIAEDSGLKQFYVEMCELHGGIASAVQPDDDAEWKLSGERRNKVLEKLGQAPQHVTITSEPIEPSTSHHQWRSFMSIAACLLVTLFIMALMFPLEVTQDVKSASEIISYSAAPSDGEEQSESYFRESEIVWADEQPAGGTDDPFADDGAVFPMTPATPIDKLEEKKDFIHPTEYDAFADDSSPAPENEKRVSALQTVNGRIAQNPPPKPQSQAVPLVGDVPVTGRLFAKKKNSKDEKSEASYAFSVDEESIERPEMTNGVDRKPSAPSSSMVKVIGSITANPTAVPVPDIAVAEPSLEFGNGDDFGDGWGDGDGLASNEVVRELESTNADKGRLELEIRAPEKTKDLMEALAQTARNQVVEVRQSNTDELDFDWIKEVTDSSGKPQKVDVMEKPEFITQTEAGSIFNGREMSMANLTNDADEQLLKGRKLYANGKYEEAVAEYSKALELLPDGAAVEDRRHAYEGHLIDGSIALSQTYRRTGRYAEARKALSEVLVKDPLNAAAKQQLEYLNDPIRTSPVLSYENTEANEKVRAHLYRAGGLQNLGKHDEAEEAYKEVLRVDRYNKAARRGMEKIASMKSDYYRAAYDQTRAELLMEVDKAWEIAVPPSGEMYKEAEEEMATQSGSLVQQEVARRAALVQEGDASVLKGKEFFSKGEYKSAVIAYEKALEMLPPGPAVDGRRKAFIENYVDGSIALADVYTQEGKFEDAKAVLKSALKKDEKNTSLIGKLKELETQKEQTPVTDEVSAADQTHSTFSLNVSDASYQLAKAALLERGEWPAAASIRTEEFINAFDYGDPKPSMAQKVACVQEQAVHPFLQQRNLLRVSMSTAAQGRSTPLNLVVLIDQSGSMERPDRAATVLRAVEELSKQLGPNDRVSLMSFARDTRLLVDSLSGDRASELVGIMKNRPSEGGTNLEQAVQVAQQHLLGRQKKGVMSRIVMLTDGAANLGDANPESLTAMVEKMRDAGIAFDACGIGFDGLDDGILEALTRKGDGRYYLLDSPEDADESFGKKIAGALRPAAKNVKVQLVFNPDRVGRYKLLGFEKHRLKKEDFRNDSVDAAEMAAEESGSALYQIEPLAEGSGEIGTVFVRFHDIESGQMVERSWTIPYQENAKSLAGSKPSIQLAAVAGLLGEKLHQSDAGSVDFSQMNKVLGNLSSHYSGDTKVQELLQMVRKVGK